MWFGNIDELWQMGKPSGWGGPWWEDPVQAGQTSDPFLMTGFDKKVLHMSQRSGREATFLVEVDFLGNGSWKQYDAFKIPDGGYVHHEFPDAFSAHWIRMTADKDCTATAYLIYS